MAAPIVAAHPRWVIAQGTHCGLPYAILSLPLGFPAVVVGVPSSSDLYGRSLHGLAPHAALCPHGEFSYSSADLPELDQRQSLWWVGWDYARCGDRANRDLPMAQDDLVAQELFSFLQILLGGWPETRGTPWSVEKVQGEAHAFCASLASSTSRASGWTPSPGAE